METRSEQCRRDKLREEAAALALSPDGREALALYYAAATQWRDGFDGPTGLDYPGVESAARAMDIGWSREILTRLRVLETETLAIRNEERKVAAEKEKAKGMRGRQ